MIEEALDAILSDHCTAERVRQLEEGAAAQALWQPVEAAGFLELLADGGAQNLAPGELFSVLACLGRHAMPLPMAQTLLVRALAAEAQAIPMSQILTIAPVLRRDPNGGMRCPATPGGLWADQVLAADSGSLWLIDAAAATRQSVGDPRAGVAELAWASAAAARQVSGSGEHMLPYAAAAMACQMAGAMQRVFGMALLHCNTREQFGKPLGKFQAIQQQLSVMAEHVLAATLAAKAGLGTGLGAPGLHAAAMAKARTSEAAGLVAASAHAVHGAIGITEALDLGLLTRRLHEWRIAYGAEHPWHSLIGRALLDSESSMLDFCLQVD